MFTTEECIEGKNLTAGSSQVCYLRNGMLRVALQMRHEFRVAIARQRLSNTALRDVRSGLPTDPRPPSAVASMRGPLPQVLWTGGDPTTYASPSTWLSSYQSGAPAHLHVHHSATLDGLQPSGEMRSALHKVVRCLTNPHKALRDRCT